MYEDGAYRLYAPRINYDRVMAEARSARARQENPDAMLAQWSREYALGDDIRPIINVLTEPGLMA